MTVPVISVGNLTMGGSGKTPVVIHLAELLKKNGYNPAVVSRGYRGSSNKAVNIVSNTDSILMDPSSVGDEPVLIASTIPGIVVATGKKRRHPCQAVVDDHKCDVIILDDGFQHLNVKRDIDLVLFDVSFFAGNSRVFPGGDLREPVNALKRCTAFVLSGISRSNKDRAEKCQLLLKKRFPQKKTYLIDTDYRFTYKYSPSQYGLTKETVELRHLPSNCLCFCGIANPERFRQALSDHSISVSDFIIFPDHNIYTEADIAFLKNKLHENSSDFFLTTEKDITKLKHVTDFEVPVYTLPLSLTAEPAFDHFIIDTLAAIKSAKQ